MVWSRKRTAPPAGCAPDSPQAASPAGCVPSSSVKADEEEEVGNVSESAQVLTATAGCPHRATRGSGTGSVSRGRQHRRRPGGRRPPLTARHGRRPGRWSRRPGRSVVGALLAAFSHGTAAVAGSPSEGEVQAGAPAGDTCPSLGETRRPAGVPAPPRAHRPRPRLRGSCPLHQSRASPRGCRPRALRGQSPLFSTRPGRSSRQQRRRVGLGAALTPAEPPTCPIDARVSAPALRPPVTSCPPEQAFGGSPGTPHVAEKPGDRDRALAPGSP